MESVVLSTVSLSKSMPSPLLSNLRYKGPGRVNEVFIAKPLSALFAPI